MEQNVQMQNLTTDSAAEKRDRSIGEKIFDWGTYGGIAGVGTFIATIPIAYWMKHKGGAETYKGASEWLKNKGVNNKVSGSLLGTFITMWGGNAMIVPVALAENNKVSIVKRLNQWFGDKTDPATIEETPKQTFGSLLWGRVAAFTTVFVGFFSMELAFPNTFRTFQDEFATRFSKTFKLSEGVTSRSYRVGHIAALDVFATASAATLLYIGSHFLAKKAFNKKIENPTGEKKPSLPFLEEAQVPTEGAHEDKPRLRVSHATREEERIAQPAPNQLAAG